MRIIYDEYGQTGNRFLSYIDSIGWAIQKKSKVIIFFPEDILKHYDNFRNSKYIILPLWGRSKIAYKVFRKILIYNNLIQKFYSTSLSRKLGFYAGWSLSGSMIYYPKVKDEIIKIFTPNKNITNPIDKLFSSVRNKGTVIVGIHFRRGDFKTFKGGKYYFEDEVFASYMQQLVTANPSICFYIASNEKISETIYTDFNVLQSPSNSAPSDLYALSRCDYIIGPPSTFSGWASMIGKVPLYHIKEKKAEINIKDFSPMRGGL